MMRVPLKTLWEHQWVPDIQRYAICSTRKCFIVHKKVSLYPIGFLRQSSNLHRVQRDQWAFPLPSCGLNRRYPHDSYVIQIGIWRQQSGLGGFKSQSSQKSIRQHKLALQPSCRSETAQVQWYETSLSFHRDQEEVWNWSMRGTYALKSTRLHLPVLAVARCS